MLAPLDICLADHGREGALSEKGDRTRSITPNLGFKPDSSLEEFFRQHLIRPLGRPADDRGNAAAIFEQTTLVLWLEPNIRETGEMQHRPEAIASIREVVAGSYGTRGRIQPAENHVEAFAENIRFISDQATRPSAGPARRYAVSDRQLSTSFIQKLRSVNCAVVPRNIRHALRPVASHAQSAGESSARLSKLAVSLARASGGPKNPDPESVPVFPAQFRAAT